MNLEDILNIIQEETVTVLEKIKKHAMYDPKSGKKVMADGEKHIELSKKGYVHYNPKKAKKAIDKEGGAAGVDAIAKHTGADKEELRKTLHKISGITKHSKGDYITTKSDRQVAEDIIMQEITAYLDEKRKKKTNFSKEKKSGLHGWFSRRGGKGKSKGWVDCNTCRKGKGGRKTCKSCGRKTGEKRAKYPHCRPTPSDCGTSKKSGKKSKAGKKG